MKYYWFFTKLLLLQTHLFRNSVLATKCLQQNRPSCLYHAIVMISKKQTSTYYLSWLLKLFEIFFGEVLRKAVVTTAMQFPKNFSTFFLYCNKYVSWIKVFVHFYHFCNCARNCSKDFISFCINRITNIVDSGCLRSHPRENNFEKHLSGRPAS